MDKSELKRRVQDRVQEMSEEERAELGQLLLESVLERWSEEELAASTESAPPEEGRDTTRVGGFDVIVDDAHSKDASSEPEVAPDAEPDAPTDPTSS